MSVVPADKYLRRALTACETAVDYARVHDTVRDHIVRARDALKDAADAERRLDAGPPRQAREVSE